jgi:ubiquinone/menaquinone biosynthesis C-methylase UbiE
MQDRVALFNKVEERNLRIFQKRYHRALVTRVLEAIGSQKKRLLDIGCGYGNITNILASKGESVIGIDLQGNFYPPYISPKLDFCRGSALHLPFRDEAFDCIISLDVLEHMKSGVDFVQEAYRILKRKGVLMIETPNRERLSVRLLSKISRHTQSFPKCYGYDSVLGEILHFKEYTKLELHNLFESFNFIQIDISGMWLGLVTPEIGFPNAPKVLEDLCQSWIVKAVK